MSRPKRVFTPAEVAICRRVGRDLTHAEARALLKTSHKVLVAKLEELQVRRPVWDTAKEATLRKHYGAPMRTLVALTGMSRDQIKRKQRQMGLTLPRKWAGTDKWIRENAARLGVDGLQRKLGMRSRSAVKMRLWRLGISLEESRDEMSMGLVAELVGVDDATVARWVAQGLLERGPEGVEPKALRSFILNNPLRVDPRRIPGESWPTLVQLLGNRW